MNNRLSYQISYLLKKHKISLDFEELDLQIKTHPSYPSLHALTGVLDFFNIENLAIDISMNPESFDQLPNSFIAQVNTEIGPEFAIINKIRNECQLILDKSTKKNISIDEFFEKSTGIVLVIEKIQNINDIQEQENSKNKLTTILLISILAISIISILLNSYSIAEHLTYFLLSLAGLYISYIIIKQENGNKTLLGNAFCSNTTEKKNCNAVLSSKGALINGTYKVSNISFVYFLGSSISCYLLSITNIDFNAYRLLLLSSILAIFYSLAYQAIIIKKWCLLCLGIVVILCANSFISVITLTKEFEILSAIIIGISLLVSTTFRFYQSSLQKANLSLTNSKLQFYSFKRNFDLFYSQLNNSPLLENNSKSAREIKLGDINNPIHITVITNPLCGHCKPVHKLLEKLLKQYSASLYVTVRFNVKTKKLDNDGTKIALRLLELYDKKGEAICIKAMSEIYGELKPDEWLKKWNTCQNFDIYLQQLLLQKEWCTDNNINFTPEVLINNRSYPKLYEREDIIHFIDNLEEINTYTTSNEEAYNYVTK